MHRLTPLLATSLALTLVLAAGCQKDKAEKEPTKDDKAGASKAGKLPNNVDKPTAQPKVDVPAPSDVAAPPADAKKTASGLAYKVMKTQGEAGERPGLNDKVSVNYTGWTTDGKMFDTSQKRKGPASFGVAKVIPGWTEGLQLMRTGESFRFWIPEELAYKGKSGPQGMLVFDVELLSISAAPKVPEDVAKPPAAAKKTPKGVFYTVLSPGEGKEKPRSFDQVSVHYSGWTTDGKMFDSSVMRGSPSSFSVDGVIAGWTDALQLMTTGDKWRVWIPKELAYNDQPGRPAGMLVFDVELISIKQMPEPPKAPADVKAPPKGAKKTSSGVSYMILEAKPNGQKPVASNQVKVDYSGWTTDGKLFDSSIKTGAPASFLLAKVVPGFRDGILEMRVGEKARLWIPEDQAYRGQPGAPKGMLVFDITLHEIIAAPASPSPHGGSPH